jgi:hypothetical protein
MKMVPRPKTISKKLKSQILSTLGIKFAKEKPLFELKSRANAVLQVTVTLIIR